MAERHFTRDQVGEFFTTNWSKFENEREHFELQEIGLYPGTTPPIWRVNYRITYTGDDGYTTYRHTYTLIAEQPGHDGPYLTTLVATMLPEHCAGVAEEDAELERRLAEWRAQHGTNV